MKTTQTGMKPAVAATSALLAMLALSPVANARDDITIERIKYGGTGCPQGTATPIISDDGEAFTVIFDNYIATLGPYVPITENRKFCQLDVELDVPQGLSFALGALTYRGFATIDKKVEAKIKTTYYLMGDSAQITRNHEIPRWNFDNYRDDFSGDFQTTDYVPALIWSPCGKDVNVELKSALQLAKLRGADRDAEGFVGQDTTDGQLLLSFKIHRKVCS